MKTVRTKAELREALAEPRRQGKRIGLVPTMGSLHDGHLTLARSAKLDNVRVIATLFVNPKQFGPAEDFATYPRDEAADAAMLEKVGVDLLFAPAAEAGTRSIGVTVSIPNPDEMYRAGQYAVARATGSPAARWAASRDDARSSPARSRSRGRRG